LRGVLAELRGGVRAGAAAPIAQIAASFARQARLAAASASSRRNAA